MKMRGLYNLDRKRKGKWKNVSINGGENRFYGEKNDVK